MIPAGLLLRVVVVVVVMLAVATIVLVGAPRSLPGRFRVRKHGLTLAPWLALVGTVLAVNAVVRRIGPDVSWIIGMNVTGIIYDIEGTFVATLQTVASPPLTVYFSVAYVYGYVFLLVFPFVAYTALDDLAPFRETALAYSINYGIGLVCYLLFIAHGPRNYVVGEPLLYQSWPRSFILTNKVNSVTNAFPSLHTSLSVAVVLLAYRTRNRYPGWLLVATPIAASIVASTMYLGIHWVTDVVAGIVLGIISVQAAIRVLPRSFADGDRRIDPRS